VLLRSFDRENKEALLMAKTSAQPTSIVIGGGPTGSTLAIELLRRGVPCRIIDRMAEPIAALRFFTLHSRTLELCEMARCAEAFLERGLQNVSMDYRFEGVTEVMHLDFTQMTVRPGIAPLDGLVAGNRVPTHRITAPVRHRRTPSFLITTKHSACTASPQRQLRSDPS
jgi:hypothetical protein